MWEICGFDFNVLWMVFFWVWVVVFLFEYWVLGILLMYRKIDILILLYYLFLSRLICWVVNRVVLNRDRDIYMVMMMVRVIVVLWCSLDYVFCKV